MGKDRLVRFAWGTLLFNLVVILWGAYVRASGSGAGCGGHWPLCNGEVLPRAPAVETLIELVHRITSGLALLLVAGLIVGVFRSRPKGDSTRWAAIASGVLILVEAGVGAALVVLGLVGQNDAPARAVVMAVHLVNTFLLLGALTLTAHFLAGGAPVSLRRRRVAAGVLFVAILLMAVGASGAIAALGDTLYPARSLAEGLRQETGEQAPPLLRLRLLHPALSIAVGVSLILGALQLQARVRNASALLAPLVALVAIQLAVGLANVYFLAPIPIQILHLFLADAIWIVFVLLSAEALGEPPAARAAGW